MSKYILNVHHQSLYVSLVIWLSNAYSIEYSQKEHKETMELLNDKFLCLYNSDLVFLNIILLACMALSFPVYPEYFTTLSSKICNMLVCVYIVCVCVCVCVRVRMYIISSQENMSTK